MPSANCSLILLSDIYVRRAKSALLDVMCQNFPQCVKTTLFTRASTYLDRFSEMYLRSIKDTFFYQPKKGLQTKMIVHAASTTWDSSTAVTHTE